MNTLKASEETRKQITANMKSVEEKIEELQKQKRELETMQRPYRNGVYATSYVI